MTELRDLEADRRYCSREDFAWDTPTEIHLKNIASAALDEIERLKRLVVWYDSTFNFWCAKISQFSQFTTHTTEAEAWAEARKAAMK